MFKLYLTGIETSLEVYTSSTWSCSNCTLQELKLENLIIRFNLNRFKLYLTGIETTESIPNTGRYLVQIVPYRN